MAKNEVDPMAALAQEHPLGCAVACVASRCQISYQKAHSFFARAELAWTRGYYCSEIVEAFHATGLEYTFAAFKPELHEKEIETSGAIVFVKPCREYPAGHFFLRTAKGWMNPWANFPHMSPVKAEFQPDLPTPVSFVVYELGDSA